MLLRQVISEPGIGSSSSWLFCLGVPTSAEISAFATTVLSLRTLVSGTGCFLTVSSHPLTSCTEAQYFLGFLSFIGSLCFKMGLFLAGTTSFSAGYSMVLLWRPGSLAFDDAFSAWRSRLVYACEAWFCHDLGGSLGCFARLIPRIGCFFRSSRRGIHRLEDRIWAASFPGWPRLARRGFATTWVGCLAALRG